MTLLVCWVVFPLVLGLLSLGVGALIEWLSGSRLPGPLLLPVGFAGVIVVADLATSNSATAQLAAPAAVTLAVVGLAATPFWRERRRDVWPAIAGAATYLCYGAPVFMSGTATFAGYIKLDDTGTWLGLMDRVMQHGRSLQGLAQSTYLAALSSYIGQTGYPVGSMAGLGVAHELVGQDGAWVYQPYMAFQAGLLALVFYALTAGLIRTPALRALAAFVAAQSALLYGYSLWGSLKELVTAPLIALLAALAVVLLRRRDEGPRTVVPLAVACAATLAVLNLGGGVWIALALVPALLLARLLPWRDFAVRAALFAGIVLVLSIPTLVTARAFLSPASHVLTSNTEYGNLIHRLSLWQFFGIWPVSDFRVRPHSMAPTYVLIGLVVLAGLWGIARAGRRGAWGVPAYAAVATIGCAILVVIGSPWLDGKALATASPAFLLAGMAGAAALFEGGRRVEAAVIVAAIAGGVLWSDALAYRAVWLAPRDQLAELQTIGSRFAGQGPALMTEFEIYGTRHFLRNVDAEGVAELRYRLIPLTNGQAVANAGYADIDQLQLAGVLVYKTLVLRRSPSESRPPSPYALAWSGRYYDVWQRPDSYPSILEHLPLGDPLQPAAQPQCTDMVRLGRLAAANGGTLAAVERAPAIVLTLGQSTHPAAWGADPTYVYPKTNGALETAADVASAGTYDLWAGGSFRGGLAAYVDGVRTGDARAELNHGGQYAPLGEVQLTPGRHVIELRYTSPGWRPGIGGDAFALGPLVLSRAGDALPVVHVAPANAGTLCGKTLDWVEAVSP